MICPRCDSENIRVMVKSPVGDVWEMYVCDTCLYSWRSTENPVVSEIFKLNADRIARLQVNLPLPRR